MVADGEVQAAECKGCDVSSHPAPHLAPPRAHSSAEVYEAFSPIIQEHILNEPQGCAGEVPTFPTSVALSGPNLYPTPAAERFGGQHGAD